ncbi:archease [Pelomicrobium methylotrophicum]|uniref:Archease n=1 Tax=Pelomicrobium methylotrophicum TaxID=2602750 RepID=A0A5C7EIA2_9PROT|nr:archease [Pelomicrobium methylotrophicum]TXF11091.1 archease [Pelomicrobium methylotrophicum]
MSDAPEPPAPDTDRIGYFDHDADIGVIGRGATPEAALAAAAAAAFALMCEPSQVQPLERVDVAFREPDMELALVIWINTLLAIARDRGLALGRFRLSREGDCWRGAAWGEPWREKHERGVEVKGATLTCLKVRPHDERWEARCVVDV